MCHYCRMAAKILDLGILIWEPCTQILPPPSKCLHSTSQVLPPSKCLHSNFCSPLIPPPPGHINNDRSLTHSMRMMSSHGTRHGPKLQLHEAGKFKAEALASASRRQKSLTLASWLQLRHHYSLILQFCLETSRRCIAHVRGRSLIITMGGATNKW